MQGGKKNMKKLTSTIFFSTHPSSFALVVKKFPAVFFFHTRARRSLKRKWSSLSNLLFIFKKILTNFLVLLGLPQSSYVYSRLLTFQHTVYLKVWSTRKSWFRAVLLIQFRSRKEWILAVSEKNIKEKLVQGIKNIDYINHHMIFNLRHGYNL